jgi:hypothetical protein
MKIGDKVRLVGRFEGTEGTVTAPADNGDDWMVQVTKGHADRKVFNTPMSFKESSLVSLEPEPQRPWFEDETNVSNLIGRLADALADHTAALDRLTASLENLDNDHESFGL